MSRRVRPGWATFLPLIVGELFELGAVEAHDEDLAVGLRIVGVEGFVFESHAFAGEGESFAVARPGGVGFVAGRVGELLEVLAIGMDGEDFEVAIQLAGEGDEIVARRPDGEVVPFIGQHGDSAIVEGHDAQSIAFRAGGAVSNVLAIGREGSKCIVAVARCNQVESGTIGIHDAHLRTAIYRINARLQS